MSTQLVKMMSSDSDWQTQLMTKLIVEMSTSISSLSAWVWIIICAGILFVLGCVLACIFRRKICKLKNNTTGKQGLKETTKLQKVALLGKCNIEKV